MYDFALEDTFYPRTWFKNFKPRQFYLTQYVSIVLPLMLLLMIKE